MTDFIDQKINLTQTCERNQWHLGEVVQALVEQGLGRADAESFAHYAFNENAVQTTGKIETISSDEFLSDEQLQRLT